MKFALLLASLLALMALSANADQPGECFHDSDNVLKIGEAITGPFCTSISCISNGTLKAATCGLINVGPPCRLGASKYPDADYPKCCVKVLHCPYGDSEI